MVSKMRFIVISISYYLIIFTNYVAIAATITAGGGGGALHFDGEDDIAQIISTAAMCDQTQQGKNGFEFGEFTIEFWYYKQANTITQVIFGHANKEGVWLSERKDDINFRIDGERSQFANLFCTDSKYKFQTEKFHWVHVAFVYRIEPGSIMYTKEMYIDGKKRGYRIDATNTGGVIKCTNPIQKMVLDEQYAMGGILEVVGSSDVSLAHAFEIDEFRIWTIGLTKEQIRSRMYRVLTPEEIKSPDLFIYWDFDESGGYAIDGGKNGLDMRLGYSNFLEDGDYLVHHMPKRVASSAPIAGSTQRYDVRDYKDIEFPLMGWDPATQRTVTTSASASAQVLSLPTSGTLSLTNGAVITATPFDVMPGNTLTFVPAPGTAGTDVSFTFTVSAAGSQPSAVQTVDITIEENHAPVVGNAGRGIHFGLGTENGHWGYAPNFVWPVQDYQTSNGAHVKGGGPITLEWWGYQTRAEFSTPNLGTLLHLDASLGSCAPGSEGASCGGAIRVNNMMAERRVGFEYGDPAGQTATAAADPSPHYGKWVHWAVTSCGADPACTEPHRLYQDGEVVTEVELNERRGYNWKELKGLNLGAMKDTWHVGIIDELRVWKGYRTRQQLQEHMYTSIGGGAATHPDLAVYYSFNEPGEETATTANDDSGNGNSLKFGGCHTANVCSYKSGPGGVVDDMLESAGRPPRVASSAPIGGYLDPIEIEYATEADKKTGIDLPGQDPDGDKIRFYITSLPVRGTLWFGKKMAVADDQEPVKLSDWNKLKYSPEAFGAGAPYANFTYLARDKQLASPPMNVLLDVLCLPGAEVDPEWYSCDLCPVGSYNPHTGGSCRSCPKFSTTSFEGQQGCTCILEGFMWDPESETCVTGGLNRCSASGCGEFATCEDDGQHCACDSGYEMAPGVIREMTDKQNFNCRLTVASSAQQRVFWGISACTNLFSLIFVFFTVAQYKYNSATRTHVVRSYLAVLLPDMVMCLVYFPFHLSNLIRGGPVDEDSCKVIAFLTFGIVIATFTGPIVVAYISYKKISLVVTQRFAQEPVSRGAMVAVMVGPWLVGVATASLVWVAGYLGSYRGLICYATRMDTLVTGGLTFMFLLISCTMTTYFYVKVHMLVRKNRKGQQENAVLKRGIQLVGALFCVWFLFAYSGILGYLNIPVSVTLEMSGSILISFQPLVDSYMIMSMRVVWQEALKYHSIQASRKPGATASSNGSSERDSSSFDTGARRPMKKGQVGPSGAPKTEVRGSSSTKS